LLWIHVCFCCVCFHNFFPLLCQNIGCDERLRNDLFYVGWDVKNLNSINIQNYAGKREKVIASESAPQADTRSVCGIHPSVDEILTDQVSRMSLGDS